LTATSLSATFAFASDEASQDACDKEKLDPDQSRVLAIHMSSTRASQY
jgi:hypothetical protein